MSSTIFYRFRSQKATSRILFDGTGITVFDLKKEIISENKLGDGTQFDLRLYNNDSNEEYADDTMVIPRSSSVIARRSPPLKQNKGNAARYVTGKPKITKIVLNNTNTNNDHQQNDKFADDANKTMTEEERINAMFANQDDQWKQTQQHMSTATPIYNKPSSTTTNTNNPDDVPPPGYMCYRCGSKDHWIKNCPTNDDPNWEGKRIKRTTGIPKTFLKTVENPDDDPTKTYLMNEEGKFVVQVADEKAWDAYKKKVNKSQQIISDLNDSVDKDFLDPITNKIMQEPVITPCCDKTYAKASIEDSLLESDFVCPNCGKEDIFLDQLKPNEELNKRIEEYLDQEFAKRGVKRNNDSNESNEKDPSKRQTLGNPPINVGAAPSLPIPPFGLPFVPPFPIPGQIPPTNAQNQQQS